MRLIALHTQNNVIIRSHIFKYVPFMEHVLFVLYWYYQYRRLKTMYH